MKDFQHIIGKYLSNHEKHKKYLAVLLALSMLVSFAVPFSLIQPADSMTIETSPLASNLSGGSSKPATGEGGYFEAVQEEIPEGAADFAEGITSVGVTPGSTEVDGSVTINAGSGDTIGVTLNLSYTMSKDTLAADHPCIYYQLPDGISIAENTYYGSGRTVADGNYSSTTPAGYFSISADGLIVIQFTDAYIDYLASSNTYTGTLQFSGTIERADTADGDKTIKIGGTTINVTFDDVANGVNKTASVADDDQGNVTITWVVEVTDYGYGLGGWTLTDANFPASSPITVSPSDLGTFTTNSTYVFNENCQIPAEYNNKVTFTYSETITVSELNERYAKGSTTVTNTATLSNGTLSNQATKNVDLAGTTISKTGAPDYQTSAYNHRIDWSVVVENPYGAPLTDYVIKDEKLANAVEGSVTLTDASGTEVSFTNNGDGTITINGTASKVILFYQTKADTVGDYTNTAYLKYPDASDYGPQDSECVSYTNPYSISKSGTYDAENEQIVWKVTAESSSSAVSLDGIVLTDEAFKGLTEIAFGSASYNYDSNNSQWLSEIDNQNSTVISMGNNGTVYGTATLDSTNGTVTFADAASDKGLHYVDFTYVTKVTEEQMAAGSVANTVTDSTGNRSDVTVTLENPYTLTKTGTYDAANGVIVWTVTAENTTSWSSTLKGVVLTDPAFSDGTLIGGITVKEAYYEWKTMNGFTIEGDAVAISYGDEKHGTVTLDRSAGTVTFANSDDGAGLNKVVFQYTTAVTTEQMVTGAIIHNDITSSKGNTAQDFVTVSNPYNLNKAGAYDAETGKVIWTITVGTPRNGTSSLNGVVLTDDAFAGLTVDNITIQSAYYNNDSLSKLSSGEDIVSIGKDSTPYGTMTINGDGTITFDNSGEYALQEVTFSYTTTPDEADVAAEKTIENTVSGTIGGVNIGSSTGKADLTNPYTVSKNGSYDQESKEITWEITVSNPTFYTSSINGMVLTDEAFKGLTVDKITIVSANYNNRNLTIIGTSGNTITIGADSVAYGTLTLNPENGTITFADKPNDSVDTGLRSVTFTYTTAPSAEQIANGAKISNTVTSNKDKNSTADVTITHRNQLAKTYVGADDGEAIVYGDDGTTARVLTWKLETLRDGGYSGGDLILVDSLSATGNGQHYITNGNSITVKAKVNSSDDSFTELTAGTHYTITYYDADGNSIAELTDDTRAVKFEIAFTEAVDNAGYRYVTVEYTTTADISGVTAEKGAASPTQATYTNTATFAGQTTTPGGYTFTRYPEDYVEKTSVTVNKSWSDNSQNTQSGVEVQLYQRAAGTSEWTAYDDPITLSASNNWSYTFNDLPKTTSDRTTDYYYKVEELTEVDGYEASYSNSSDGVTSGSITITNTVTERCDKVPLDASGNALTSGASVKLSDLKKETIDGTAYYIIGWQLTPSKTPMTLTDTLPEGFTLCADADSSTKVYGPFVIGSNGYYKESIVGWTNTVTYAVSGNTITFVCDCNWAEKIVYYTKIPVTELESQFTEEILTYGVANTVVTPNGNTTTSTLSITKSGTSGGTDNGLLTKNGRETLIPGRLQYTILVNPEGKTLAGGGTIDISDLFNITDYTGLTDEQIAALNASLVKVDVQEVTVSYDADGNPVAKPVRYLTTNEYTYTVAYKPIEVTEQTYEFTKAEGVERWVTTDCKVGETVTLVVNRDAGWGLYVYCKENDDGYTWNSIQQYEISSVGTYDSEKQQYTLTFTVPEKTKYIYVQDNNSYATITSVKADAVLTTQTSTATLNVSVPDETPLLITYEYDITGTTLHTDDQFTVNNTASFDTGNASATDSADETQFIVVDAGATVSGNAPPRIVKADTNDYTVTMEADFKLAYYDSGTKQWVFAVGETVDEKGNHIPVWGTTCVSADNTIPEGAYEFTVESISTSLDTGTLYKIVEVDVPDQYVGSNLVTHFNALLTAYLNGTYTGAYADYLVRFVTENPGATTATFEHLLQMYLKGYTGGPYDNFFNIFQSTFYFSYGSESYTAPDGFTETVMTVPISGSLNLPNSKLIQISAEKSWDATMTSSDASVKLELYWSTVKKSDGYPTSIQLATAANLGLLEELENPKIIRAGETAQWNELPSGINGKPIYYYIKETAYTIGGITYKLEGEHYVGYNADGTPAVDEENNPVYGSYKPIYTGNGASGSDTTISVYNTRGLMLQKLWRNSDNSSMTENIPLTEVPVKLYGTTASGTTVLIDTFTLTADEDWTLWIPDTYDLSNYVSFVAVEALTSDQLYGYTISYVYNTNGPAGSIQIINKDSTPTAIDVSVAKEWSDGNSKHADDAVTVNLYRTTERQTDNGISLVETATPLDSQVLNAGNSWSYTWSEQPYKSETNQRYYYYVVEVSSTADGYTASYQRVERSTLQSVTINNAIPATLRIEKIWQDTDGVEISGNSAALPDSITLEIYQKLYEEQLDTSEVTPPSDLKAYAFGDSITNGYVAGVKYSDLLQQLLQSDGYLNAYVNNTSTVGHKIEEITSAINSSGLDASYDVVIVMAGTNNLLNTDDTMETMQQKMKDLLDAVYAKSEDAIVFVSSIPRITALDWYKRNGYYCNMDSESAVLQEYQTKSDTLVADYNNMLKELAANYTYADVRKTIYYVDSYDETKDLLSDGCHPDADGQQKIADKLEAAINLHYGIGTIVAPPSDIDYFPEDLTSAELVKTVTIEPDANGSWKLNLADLPAENTEGTPYIYYVKEKDGDTAAYLHNGQLLNDSAQTIQITNTVETAKTEIHVKKIWHDGTGSGRPDSITLTLERSTDEQSWEPLTNTITWTTQDGGTWEGSYSNLPVYAGDGVTPYYYRVTETVPDGYIAAYSAESVSSAGVTEADRTIAVTNTRTFSLTVKKEWADGFAHNGDTVTVEIHRSTDPSDVPEAVIIEPDLAADKSALSITVAQSSTVTVNKTGVTVTFDNADIAEAAVNDKTITVSGKAAGTTTMHITDGATTVDVAIEVTAEPTLSLTISPSTIEAGGTAALIPEMSDGTSTDGVEYTVKDSGIVSISGNTITGIGVGATTITATLNGKTATADITVNLPASFTLSASPGTTVTVGGTTTVSPSPAYGTFTYESSNPAIAAVDRDSGVVTGVAAGTATITATRNDGTRAEIEVTVEEETTGGNVVGSVTLSGETKTCTIYINEQKSDVEVQSIIFDVKDYSGSDGFYIRFANSTTHLEWSQNEGSFTIRYYGSFTADGVTKCTVSVDGTKITVSGFEVKLNQLIIDSYFESVTLDYTITYSADSATAANLVNTASLSTSRISRAARAPTFVEEVTLSATNTAAWAEIAENLPAYDEAGNPYYYWVVESAVSGYDVSYSFEDDDGIAIDADTCINGEAPGNAVATVRNTPQDTTSTMPSTGGRGTAWNYGIGMTMICGSAAASILIRRRRRKAS